MYPLTGAAGLDLEADVLAPLRKSLQDGGPKARAWANVKTSPYSAIAMSALSPGNELGQCGGGYGGPVEAVKAAWAKYKKQDKECAGCGCESEGAKFCNYDNKNLKSGTCQSCDDIERTGTTGSRPGYCNYLSLEGAVDCKKQCFGEHLHSTDATHSCAHV